MVRAGFPNDRRRAANVVGMTVRENQVPEIARGASKLPDRIEHKGCLVGKTRVHERKLGSAIEQHSIGRAQMYEIGSLNDLLQAHVCIHLPKLWHNLIGQHQYARRSQQLAKCDVYNRRRVLDHARSTRHDCRSSII